LSFGKDLSNQGLLRTTASTNAGFFEGQMSSGFCAQIIYVNSTKWI